MRTLFLSAAAATLALAGCRGWESDQPPVHLIPNMDTQEKGRPYRKDDTGFFADGRVMRAPPEGTVAIGELGDDDYWENGLEADGGFAQKFPAAIKLDDPALRARGKQRYQIYCTPCHGIKGDGKGPVATRVPVGQGGLMVQPPSFHDVRLKEMTNGQIYKAIKYGVNNGNMPSYATQIPVADRWQLIAGIREMQREVDPKQVDEPGAIEIKVSSSPTVEYGASLYKAKGCNACHSLDGTRIVGPTWKGIWGRVEKTSGGDVTVDEAYVKESIENPNAKIVEGYPPAMPPVVPALDKVAIDSLILFMKEQK
jgi:mono/diheme cytochrome c family protein/cytochrome c551/c552